MSRFIALCVRYRRTGAEIMMMTMTINRLAIRMDYIGGKRIIRDAQINDPQYIITNLHCSSTDKHIILMSLLNSDNDGYNYSSLPSAYNKNVELDRANSVGKDVT